MRRSKERERGRAISWWDASSSGSRMYVVYSVELQLSKEQGGGYKKRGRATVACLFATGVRGGSPR